MKKNKKIYYYREFTDDVVKSKNQEYKLKDKYIWIKNNIFYRTISFMGYWLMWIFGYIYCKLVLKVKIKNKKVLKKYRKTGYFIYGNHTQELGDVFIPTIVSSPKRAYFVCSQANLGVKGIGKFLPLLGAFPIPQKLSKMKLFHEAVRTRIKQKNCVVIYPEAHVWPYYTEIRNFTEISFKYPLNLNVPSFCITTTYQKIKEGKKPRITVFVDGPFIANNNLSKEENAKIIHNNIFNCMKNRSGMSNYKYVEYIKERD